MVRPPSKPEIVHPNRAVVQDVIRNLMDQDNNYYKNIIGHKFMKAEFSHATTPAAGCRGSSELSHYPSSGC